MRDVTFLRIVAVRINDDHLKRKVRNGARKGFEPFDLDDVAVAQTIAGGEGVVTCV